MTDDEILLAAAAIRKRRYREKEAKRHREYSRRPEVIARRKANRKVYARKPETKAQARQRYHNETPEERQKRRDRQRRLYWKRNHPGQPVPLGRIEEGRRRQENSERIDEEIAALE